MINSVKILEGLAPQVISTNTTTAGAIVDTQGFDSLTWAIQSGTLTDGTYTVLIEEGDAANLSDAAAVADADLTNTELSASFVDLTDDNQASKIGYIGSKRYVRLSIVSAATTVGALIGSVAILGNPSDKPQDTIVN